MQRVVAWIGTAGALFALGVVGCNASEDMSTGSLGTETAPSDPGVASTATGTCTANAAPLEKLDDPSTLPACAPACGGAHCVPGDKVPEAGRSMFA